MSTQLPGEGFLQGASRNPNSHTFSAPRTPFPTSEFRTKVVEILSRTANGCLQELGYQPGMTHQITELQNRVNSFQEENRKLYTDNQRLAQMIKDIREKQIVAVGFYTGTIHSLERQILSLQKENQDVLTRERSLAAGKPDYARLQADYMRLQGFCSQLKQQVGTLQKFLTGNPPPQPPQVMISSQQNTVVVGNPHKQPSVQEALQAPQQHQQQHRFMVTGHPDQQPQNQSVFHSQSHSQTSIPPMTGPFATQNNPESQSIATSSAQTFSQANQVLLNHKTGDPSVSRPSSSSSRHSNDMMGVDAQGFRLPGYKPVLYGWPGDTTGPTIVTNLPPQIYPPRRQASAPSTLSGGNPKVPPSPMNTSTTAPMTDGASTRLPHHLMPKHPISIPFVNPAIGTNVVPIGPPGKFLPPLAASIMKPQSPLTSSTRPPFPQTHLASTRVLKPPPPIVDRTNSSPVEPLTPITTPHLHSQSQSPASVEVNEILQTPNLTPTSSRASAAPSEDVPETTTPLDTPISPTIGLVGSPGTVMMEDAGQGFGSEMASSMKRGSMHITDGIGEGVISSAEGIRKKRRLSEEVSPKPGDPTTAGPADEAGVISTHTSGTTVTEAMGEGNDEDEDIEEEEEIGPDGARSVKYCLEAFTDDSDDGVPTCLLCLSRFRNGLIKAAARFPSDMPQEEKVQHFLDEHPTSWDDFRFARNG